MPTVIVQGHPAVEGELDATLLDVCDAHGIHMECACGGFACCNSCRVEVIKGAENLSPVEEDELPFLERIHQRLGCQARLLGPVSVRLDPGM